MVGRRCNGRSFSYCLVRVNFVQGQYNTVHLHPVIANGQISEISSGTTGNPEQRRKREF